MTEMKKSKGALAQEGGYYWYLHVAVLVYSSFQKYMYSSVTNLMHHHIHTSKLKIIHITNNPSYSIIQANNIVLMANKIQGGCIDKSDWSLIDHYLTIYNIDVHYSWIAQYEPELHLINWSHTPATIRQYDLQ